MNTEAQAPAIVRASLSLNTEQHFPFKGSFPSTSFPLSLCSSRPRWQRQSFSILINCFNHAVLIKALEGQQRQCTSKNKHGDACLIRRQLHACLSHCQKSKMQRRNWKCEFRLRVHVQMRRCNCACANVLSATE